jgi:hypothetical protein
MEDRSESFGSIGPTRSQSRKQVIFERLVQRILQDNGLLGSFGVYQPNPQRLNIYVFSFWSATEITYFIDQQRLLVEDQHFRWSSFLTGLHAVVSNKNRC